MKDEDLLGIAEHDAGYNWLPNFVYGGIDGAVTTFAVVAGVEGAALSLPIILILGFANLFADGFSMAVGKYFSDVSDLEQHERIRQIEFNHLETRREKEVDEVREIMEGYGFKGKDLKRAVEIITNDPEAWVDLMMRNEFNLTRENVKPLRGSAITFFSFLLIGFIPLTGYTFRAFIDIENDQMFLLTCISTLTALFIVGAVKSKFSIKSWYRSGIETLLIGGAAAGIAYFVGYLLRGLL